MEDLARAGFSWHSNPGCLRCRSATPLICQRFPPVLWEVDIRAHEDGALVGRMAVAVSIRGISSFAAGEWLTLFTVALPGHLNKDVALSQSKALAI